MNFTSSFRSTDTLTIAISVSLIDLASNAIAAEIRLPGDAHMVNQFRNLIDLLLGRIEVVVRHQVPVVVLFGEVHLEELTAG